MPTPSTLPVRIRSWRWPIIVPVAIGVVLLGIAAVLVVRWFLYATDAGRGFLAQFPGTTPLPEWAPVGLPVWLNWSHFLNAFLILLVAKTGWMVRTTKRPAAMWTPKSPKTTQKISIEIFTHVSLDLLWLANGIVFIVLLFATGQFIRIVPHDWSLFPNAVSAGLQYVSLDWPTEHGWVNYNSLQVLMYFLTVFVAAPLAAITGFRMSMLWPKKATRLSKAYPMELARAIHFPVMLYFVAFTIVHVTLVLATSALANLNHMFASQDAVNWWGFGIFLGSLAAMVAGWALVRPLVMKQFGALVGKVSR
ncbi:MAG TPA: cytochrome b/b6 domain-containing protein [Microbacteriaceae bacterium]|nr:cytochrome b/b6 domain-containing protein [Microbacteriaceae bacterium]